MRLLDWWGVFQACMEYGLRMEYRAMVTVMALDVYRLHD
jgi:hypothetical protein